MWHPSRVARRHAAAAIAGSADAWTLAPPRVRPQAEDMAPETAQEALEIVTAAVDKFLATENYEAAAKLIKEVRRTFAAGWGVTRVNITAAGSSSACRVT